MYSNVQVPRDDAQSKWLKQEIAVSPLYFLQDPAFFMLEGRRMSRAQNSYYERLIRFKVPKSIRPSHQLIFSELHDHFKSPNYKYMGIEECDFYCYTHQLSHNLVQCFASSFINFKRVQEKLDQDQMKAQFFALSSKGVSAK